MSKSSLPGYMGALVQCEIKLVTMAPGEWGEIFFDDDLIHISRAICLSNQLQALLHECLHWRWPNKTEDQIIDLEQKKWQTLKAHELRALLNALYPPRVDPING